MAADPRLTHNVQQQHDLYGVAIGDSVREVTAALGITQAAVARAMGVSAPMLSQLVSGQRIKLGNPQAVHRLQALLDLVEEVRNGLPPDRVPARLEQIGADDAGTLTRPRQTAASPAAAVTALLRAVASGRELAAAADLLRADHPDLADVLRIYGTGRAEDAERHWAALGQLV